MPAAASLTSPRTNPFQKPLSPYPEGSGYGMHAVSLLLQCSYRLRGYIVATDPVATM